MITLHTLKFSRATRVLWLLEDLEQPCERIDYDRTPEFRAPEALSRVHPLGKSPVIEDDGEMIAESSTILRYLVDKYGDESHRPPRGTREFWRHEALFDYVEASFAEVALQAIMPAFRGKDVPDDAGAALGKHLDYITGEPGEGPLLFGSRLMLADIQISYILALLDTLGLLGDHPQIAEYWKVLQEQPGYIAATRAAGPMAPPN
ncbi:glutathione S-transferase family protein [Hoeflea ulvae]|uniref:Glutathione S-transferase n=1 Tax=Hoeflea ulvae TaxID=2983764 RepID=A0ABT3YCU1_9HYPH|nr:glutathione S-transferase [Hoeflea ulvae]MCY0093599.1 glutathione S-transferase [Hoeflea ulvae]